MQNEPTGARVIITITSLTSDVKLCSDLDQTTQQESPGIHPVFEDSEGRLTQFPAAGVHIIHLVSAHLLPGYQRPARPRRSAPGWVESYFALAADRFLGWVGYPASSHAAYPPFKAKAW